MKEQVLDVWADLRDRRLWPVAALLLVCLVAVPVVLVKPAEEAPSKAATPSTATGNGDPLAKQAVVQAFDAKPLVKVSNLDQFASKDPFKPIEQLKPLSASDVVGTTGDGSGAQSATGGAGDTAGGGTGGASPGGTTGGGGTQPVQPAPGPKTKKFTYVVDLSFGTRRDVKRYHGFDRLGMLPSENSPLLVYLGVDGTGTQAAFLVDSTLDASGEGHCKPSTSSCGVVYLEPGEKETFDDGQGHVYELVLDQIRKVEVRAKGATAGKVERPVAGTTDQQQRHFLFPVLIDLETGVHP